MRMQLTDLEKSERTWDMDQDLVRELDKHQIDVKPTPLATTFHIARHSIGAAVMTGFLGSMGMYGVSGSSEDSRSLTMAFIGAAAGFAVPIVAAQFNQEARQNVNGAILLDRHHRLAASIP